MSGTARADVTHGRKHDGEPARTIDDTEARREAGQDYGRYGSATGSTARQGRRNGTGATAQRVWSWPGMHRSHSMHCPGIGSSCSQIDRGRRMTQREK
jgi:hypothetical protein